MIFADDADQLDTLRAAAYAAEDAHTAACVVYRRALADYQRSKSAKRAKAYREADDAMDAALEAAHAAGQAFRRAHLLAERRMAQAIRAARHAARGVQLQLAL